MASLFMKLFVLLAFSVTLSVCADNATTAATATTTVATPTTSTSSTSSSNKLVTNVVGMVGAVPNSLMQMCKYGMSAMHDFMSMMTTPPKFP